MTTGTTRAAFEAWADKHGLNTKIHDGLHYSHVVGWAWQAWQAARHQGEPVAYAVFADNGNIRIWSREPLDEPGAVALYTNPQPTTPSCDMGEHSCANPTQCWEPCGELGKSDEHAKVVTSHEFDYAALEKEHFGCPENETGIYATPAQAPEFEVRERGFLYENGKHTPTLLLAFPIDDWDSRDRLAAMLAAAPKFGEEE